MIPVTKQEEPRELDEAFEALDGDRDAPVFLTCEHASERLPDGYAWPPGDERLVGTHWAYDLGAADLVRELAEALRAPAVLSRFSRLLVDPNRPDGAATLFRAEAEGQPVGLNRQLTDAERTRRLERFHRPYHEAIHQRLAGYEAQVLFSVHTFTPVYEGQVRQVEVGVLFDTQEELAAHAARAIHAAGFVTRLNEPYSGREGLIYAAERHAAAHGKMALELEVRQDLAVRPEVRARLVDALAGFFRGRAR
ncbi:N-formylglutamate amidohydrolase [Vulgatibacter sp.]|uniref:N-formylglutamate amidohydrolase n=1 Tax=Vulgatibacter sp. TaxID=1971226 RepID=UPI0035641281